MLYLVSAENSANFIANQLYDGAIILDTISLENCFRTTLAVTYNSGFTIEGLSILAAKNGSYANL
jgi:hypothetical protein